MLVNNTVSGALAGHGPDFAAYLATLGYAPTSIGLRLNLLRHFSHWLDRHHLTPADCHTTALDDYLRQRALTHTDIASPGTIRPLFDYLRSTHTIPQPPPTPPQPGGPADVLLDEWAHYLLHQRGLSQVTISYYRTHVLTFVRACLPDGDTSSLSAGIINRFTSAHFPTLTPTQSNHTTTAMRSFLTFLYTTHRIPEPLDHIVLRPIWHKDTSIPRGLAQTTVETLIASIIPDTWCHKRNLAIMLLLARLGLRASEVATLTLDDIGWDHGTIRIHGKGGYIDTMPLPTDVGEAIADYLKTPKHPAMTGRALFHSARAPYRPITAPAVKGFVRSATKLAGIGPVGTHCFRHTLATVTINTGASLEEVNQIMRHRHLGSTTIYAKVDLTRLRLITRTWPGATHEQGHS